MPEALPSRSSLERMMLIHNELRRGSGVTAAGLGQRLEVSGKTILRDLAFMRDRLDLPIEYDDRAHTLRYSHPVAAFPTVKVTEGELLALLVARRALEQYRGTPFHRQLSIAFDKLSHSLRDRISFSPADELSTVSFKNIGLGKTDLALFNSLSTAVLKQVEVTFAYRKPGDSRSAPRTVRPYHLANRQNLWYLVGYDLEREALRTFALPRIAELAVTKQRFARPTDFSPEEFFASALGVFGGEGDHRVVVRFTAEAAERVREREWHDTQEMRDLPGGGLELRMRLGALGEVRQWVLGWGDAAEVVSPPELRASIGKIAAALAARYGAGVGSE